MVNYVFNLAYILWKSSFHSPAIRYCTWNIFYELRQICKDGKTLEIRPVRSVKKKVNRMKVCQIQLFLTRRRNVDKSEVCPTLRHHHLRKQFSWMVYRNFFHWMYANLWSSTCKELHSGISSHGLVSVTDVSEESGDSLVCGSVSEESGDSLVCGRNMYPSRVQGGYGPPNFILCVSRLSVS